MPSKRTVAPTPSSLEARIAEAAYYKAVQRGFAPGHELADWFAAEHELTATPVLEGAAKAPKKTRSKARSAAPTPKKSAPGA